MAGEFYAIARNDMNARMRDKTDRTVNPGEWQVPVKPAKGSTDAESQGGFLSRMWRLATRPTVRKAEGSSSL